jgi:hypothetical protein
MDILIRWVTAHHGMWDFLGRFLNRHAATAAGWAKRSVPTLTSELVSL